MVKVTAITDVRIRIDGVKQDVKKWETHDIPEDRVGFFISNGFILAQDKVSKGDIQTTDGSLVETRWVKKVSTSKKSK